ncbi:MAG TPA: SpoIIE family protein phosphatase [Roseiflexaceae bacterium]|nr:SpoIIE family protein phosphatase [Roseiflexaceae bacterium]
MRRPPPPGPPAAGASPLAIVQGARRSISSRLRWSYLISSTVPLLFVGALLLFINLNSERATVFSDQQASAGRVARDISRYVGALQQQLENYALQVRPGTPQAQLTEAAQNVQARNFPNLIDLAVIADSGVERLRVYRLQAIPADQLRDMSQDSAVRRALYDGATTYSPIAPGRDGRRTFIVTLPLRNDAGAVVGALRAEISAEPIARELRVATESSTGHAYLLDSATGAVLLDDGQPDFAPPRETWRLLRNEQGAAEYLGARGEAVIGAIVPVYHGEEDTPTGWAVVVEQPSAEAFANVRRSALVLTSLVVLVGVIALIWAFRQAQRFLRPLRALRAGAIALGEGHLNHRITPLGDDELGDVATAFNQMADHLEASLAEIEQQNDQLRRGLALARDIQVGLLPERPPWNGEALAVYARSIPAYDVGGDFYTYLALSEGRAAIAIGDVSGKGIGAALIMALTSSAVETQGRQFEHPAKVLSALNQLLAPRLKANHMNAALLFAVFDPRERTVRIANAGMIAPVVISPQGNRFVEVGGLPLGAMAGAMYYEETVQLGPGEGLLLVSDGVVEAHSPSGELFGFERLEATIGELRTFGDVRALVELVLSRVHEHMGLAEQHDDITIVAVRPPLTSGEQPANEEQSVDYAAV